MDRLVRGRGRNNVAQNGEPFGLEGGVNGVAAGTAMLGLGGECEYECERACGDLGVWYPVCGRGLLRDDVDRVRGRGEGDEGEDADGMRGLG